MPINFVSSIEVTPQDLKPTGVLVFSAGTPVTLTIANNHIFNNTFGIWLSKPVTAAGLNPQTNTFTNVTTPVSSGN